METVGMRPVLVHGGGRSIDRAMDAAGLRIRKVQGRRYTDDRALEIVVHVLVDDINAGIVRDIRSLGGRAVGLHSEQLQCLFGERLELTGDGQEPVDLGRVGRVTRVDRSLIEDFCAAGVVPVIPSLAFDEQRQWLNVNADTAAASVAGNLARRNLSYSPTRRAFSRTVRMNRRSLAASKRPDAGS